MKSLKWKIFNSLWIIPTLLPFFIPYINGIPFIYVGIRMKKKLWIFFGIFISILAALSMHFENNADLGTAWWSLSLFAIFYVFVVLYEYLNRLEVIEETQETLEEKIFQEYGLKLEKDYRLFNKNNKKIILNSLWIIPAFIPLLNGLSFIYAGLRVRKKLWICIGFPLSLIWFIAIEFNITNQFLNELIPPLAGISWILGMIYILYVLREYLIRLDAMKRTQIINKEKNLQKNDIVGNGKYSPADVGHKEGKFQNGDSNIFGKLLVDINRDLEDKLTQLPGINLILAKKIIEIRSLGHEFSSVEDLGEKLNLKPYMIEKLRYLVIFSDKKNNKLAGRKVDF